MVFADRLVTVLSFFSEIACAIGFGYARLAANRKSFPANYSLIMQTAKDLHSMVP